MEAPWEHPIVSTIPAGKEAERMADLLQGLNDAQREAVTTTEGVVRVIAGAGSGKTRALSRRFAYLVNEVGILPENILCVTFTNKSANEMRQRIHALTGDNDTGYINTFHGFCVSVLQEDSHAIQYPKSFLVLDNADIDAMLKIIYEERGLTLRDMTFSNARDMIEIQKIFERPGYYLDILTMSIDVLHEKYLAATSVKDIIFFGYLYQEKKCFGLDYNDLIKFTLYLFEEREDIRLKWQKRLEYIMIDEFQDIDNLQYQLMEVLCGYHKNLFVVGDPDQTIYTWRGANVRYLLDFDKHFPAVKTVMMMENYRSTPEILAAANSLIGKNRERIKKDLLPQLDHGQWVSCFYGPNSEAESDWIAGQVLALHEGGVPFPDLCVLYRAHYVTRTVEEAFLKAKVPYTIYSGVQFFGRAEVKDALSYLRMVAYQDDLSFLRIANVPKRNLGERRMNFLKSYAADQACSLYQALCDTIDDPVFKGTKAREFVTLIQRYNADYSQRPISELLSALLNDSGYETALRTEGSQERLDNLAELKQSVYEYETTCGEEARLEHYLAHVALFSNSDTAEQAGKVKLMTVHSAKGLEFPYVFLCGMNEGIFPSRKVKTLPGMEEERRLAFVAVTRAQKGLYLTGSEGRNLDGSPRYPSRFLIDIDQELLDYAIPPREGLLQEARDAVALSDLLLRADDSVEVFPAGQRVVHAVFGTGTVVEVDLVKKAHMIQFDDMDTPRAISFRAKLRAIETEPVT
jgi:DNA helicase-2/ATP-dependent DNA helicase PcrA